MMMLFRGCLFVHVQTELYGVKNCLPIIVSESFWTFENRQLGPDYEIVGIVLTSLQYTSFILYFVSLYYWLFPCFSRQFVISIVILNSVRTPQLIIYSQYLSSESLCHSRLLVYYIVFHRMNKNDYIFTLSMFCQTSRHTYWTQGQCI